MSILIKGMDKIPEDGAVLVVKHDDDGKAYIKYAGMMGYSMELVELPEKHGDLIDRDTLVKDLINGIKAGLHLNGYEEYPNINNMDDCVECVRYADTVIKAEGEE